ncbi:MAG: AAA family ATPase [Myxococcales bacterium]|nr:AAA family ATPase [Myxococcales bacterium]
MDFFSLRTRILERLRQEGRLSYAAIRRQFEVDDAFLADLRQDLRFSGEPVDEIEGGLAWKRPATARAPSEPERRQLTVMFCDLVGSTALSARLDAEELRDTVLAYQRETGAAVEQFGGWVAQYLGDGILVYFGYPAAREDDAARALRAALAVVETVRSLGAKIGHRLAVRVGVHSGLVVVGDVGAGVRKETLALGEAPNIASRVQGEAGENQVVASADTWRLAGDAFFGEELGERVLKGVARKIGLVRVLGVRDTQEQRPRARATLVGREAELADLWAAYSRGGAARVVRGEAGIGKSHLVQTLAERVQREGGAVLRLQASAFHLHSALSPFVDALGQAAGIGRGESDDTRFGKLSLELGRCGVDAAHVPLLASLLGIPPAEGRELPLGASPQRMRSLTLEGLTSWALGFSGDRRALLVVEDLHWLDPTSLELVDTLLGRIGPDTFVVLTARLEARFERPVLAATPELVLDRLSEAAVRQLVTQAAPHLSPELVQRILEKTDGVPLFIEEVTRTVAEDRGAEDRGPTSGIDVPTSLYGSLMARLDRLGAGKTIAQAAAVLGRTFGLSMLLSIVDAPEAVVRHSLAQLSDAQLLAPIEAMEPSWSFRHALIQEAAYQSLLRSTRQSTHGRIARAFLDRFPDAAAAEPERVATHFAEAGEPGPAIEHLMKAGIRDLQRSANAEAIHHFERVLEQVALLPDPAMRENLELQVQGLLAVPHTLTKGWAAPEVGRAYTRAAELCARLDNAPQLLPTRMGLFTFYLVRAEHDRALELATADLALAEQTNDSGLILEAAHNFGAVTLYRGGLREAQAPFERTVALFDPEKHAAHMYLFGKDPRVTAFVHLSMVHNQTGDLAAAERTSEAGVAAAENVHHPFSLAWSLIARAFFQTWVGEHERCLATAERIIALAGEQGFPNWVGQGLVYRGWALARAGRKDEGLGSLRQGIELWKMTGSELVTPMFHALHAGAALHLGELDEADQAVAAGLAQADRTGEHWMDAENLRLLGLVCSQRGDAAGAAQALDRAAADAAARGLATNALRIAHTRLLLARGDERGARREEVRQKLGQVHAERPLPFLDTVRSSIDEGAS